MPEKIDNSLPKSDNSRLEGESNDTGDLADHKSPEADIVEPSAALTDSEQTPPSDSPSKVSQPTVSTEPEDEAEPKGEAKNEKVEPKGEAKNEKAQEKKTTKKSRKRKSDSAPSAAASRSKASSKKPAASEPAASEPAASEPAASEPAASEPAASEPAASEPAGTNITNDAEKATGLEKAPKTAKSKKSTSTKKSTAKATSTRTGAKTKAKAKSANEPAATAQTSPSKPGDNIQRVTAAPNAANASPASQAAQDNPATPQSAQSETETPDISQAADEIFINEHADVNGFAVVAHEEDAGATESSTADDLPRKVATPRDATHAADKQDNTAELLAQLIEKLDDPTQSPRRSIWPAAAAVGLVIGLGAGVAISSAFPRSQDTGAQLEAARQAPGLDSPLVGPVPPGQTSIAPTQPAPSTTAAPLMEMKGTAPQQSNVIDLQGGQSTLQYSSDGGSFRAQLITVTGQPMGEPLVCEGPCNTKATVAHSPGPYKVKVDSANSSWAVSIS